MMNNLMVLLVINLVKIRVFRIKDKYNSKISQAAIPEDFL